MPASLPDPLAKVQEVFCLPPTLVPSLLTVSSAYDIRYSSFTLSLPFDDAGHSVFGAVFLLPAAARVLTGQFQGGGVPRVERSSSL